MLQNGIKFDYFTMQKKVKICSVQATALCFKYVSYWPCWCSKKQLLCWYQLLGRNYEQKLIILHILESKFIISMFFSKCIFYQWNPAEKWWSLTMLVKKSNIFHCKVLEWEGNDLAFLLLKNACTQPKIYTGFCTRQQFFNLLNLLLVT